MEAQLATQRRFTRQERQDMVRRLEQSGLTVREFCLQANVRVRTLSRWRQAAQRLQPAFAHVQLTAGLTSRADGTAVLHLAGGAKLEVSVASAEAWRGLGVMLHALGGATP